ncbi:MAG TPA: hypothetical protein VHC22_07315 [Pirellulales bacterium]|nr:hypothetical protein [Pirellulales bacterium]
MAVRFTLWLTCLICVAHGSLAVAGSPSKPSPLRSRGAPAAAKPNGANNASTKAANGASTTPAAPSASTTADDKTPPAGTKTYLLRYKFKPRETLRWEVEHRAKIRSTVQGTTQTAETSSSSIKIWKVESVDAEGNATLVYSVERVEMTQKYDGRQETRYNSETDTKAPPGYDKVAEAVGKPLAQLTLNPRGDVINREERYVQAAPMQENVTLPLPENAVAIGEEWTMPADITVTIPEGERKTTRKIKARQLYRLESVDDGMATIRLETQVLTPLNDPQIESQIVQSKANGHVRFDIAAGRIVSQQSDVDEHVSGFQGPASSLHYITRFSEKLLPGSGRAAVYPKAPQKR